MQSRVEWSSKLLWTFWVLQSIIFVLCIIALGLSIGMNAGTDAYTAGILFGELVFFILATIFVVVEILTHYQKGLNVWVFFGLQLFKSFFWTAILALCALSVNAFMNVRKRYGYANAWPYIIITYMVITSLIVYGVLIYSCKQVHRHRKSRVNARPGKTHSAV